MQYGQHLACFLICLFIQVLSKLLQQPHLVGTSITTLRQLSVATSQISIKTTRYQLNQTEVQQLPGNARVIVRQLEQFISELEARLEEGNQVLATSHSNAYWTMQAHSLLL